MALKKPSDLFGKKSEENEIPIVESDNSFREELTKVESLSEQITQLQQELSQKVVQTDLEKLVLSQISSMQENFEYLQNDFRKSNKKDIAEFKERVSELTDIVGNLVENELPKYKKYVTKNEVRIGEKFDSFKDSIKENIDGIKEEIDTKINDIAEVIDNNLEYFNNQLQETSSEVKNTADTYSKLSKIVEGRISKENEQLEEYSKVIQSLHESFVELQNSIQEGNDSYRQNVEEVIEVKFKDISLDVDNKIGGISEDVKKKINSLNEDVINVSHQVSDIKADVVINEQHIKNVDKYLQEHHQELIELREEVFTEIEQIPVGNLQENIERLEKKIDYIKETYSKIEPEVVVKEVIKEGLLNEPPETNNSDSLTPLNQNFVTLNQLQEHYRLFINRIQQQLSTLGGGGETRLKYLDDIVGIATNPSAYNNKFLKYNHSIGKFEFATAGGGAGSQTLDDTLQLGNTSSLGMSVGVITATQFVGDGSLLTNVPGSSNSGYANTAGIATYASRAGIATYATTAGVSTSVIGGIGSITQLRVSGVSTLGVTTFTGNVSFGTSAFFGTDTNLNFGNNNNLQLYYNSVNSIVSASGGLIVSGSSITYSSDAHSIQNAATTRTFANFAPSGTTFYYDNNTRFQVTTSGVTVTGTTSTDQLNVSGVGTFQSSRLQIRNPANTFGYNISGGAIAANYTITLPVVTSNTGVALTGIANTFTQSQTINGVLTVQQGMSVANTGGAFTYLGTSSSFNVTNQTTGQINLGGTTQTGTITLGRSTATQQTDIQAGASGVGSSKTINFGTGGLSGSFTQINIGPTAGLGTVSINSGTNLLVGTTTSTGTASQPLQVTGGGYFSGNVGIGTTVATEVLSVLPKIQILNNSNADGRLILRAKPGNSYRWNLDNDGDTNNLRFFREDDATAANGTVPLSITPTGNATLSGNLNAAGNYYVKLARTSNQTITSLSDTLIGFSAMSDPNSWFNSGNNRITPNVAGNYYISAMVKWEAGASADAVQTNIQIRKTGTTVALSVLGTQTHAYTMNVSAIVTLNGSTDYIELTAYTGNPTSQVIGGDASGTLTKLEMFKLN